MTYFLATLYITLSVTLVTLTVTSSWPQSWPFHAFALGPRVLICNSIGSFAVNISRSPMWLTSRKHYVSGWSRSAETASELAAARYTGTIIEFILSNISTHHYSAWWLYYGNQTHNWSPDTKHASPSPSPPPTHSLTQSPFILPAAVNLLTGEGPGEGGGEQWRSLCHASRQCLHDIDENTKL